jgi:hypothetical protein
MAPSFAAIDDPTNAPKAFAQLLMSNKLVLLKNYPSCAEL